MQPPQAFRVNVQVGLAERGQRRVKGPPYGLDQFGLDPYIAPDCLIVLRDVMQKPPRDCVYWLYRELRTAVGTLAQILNIRADKDPDRGWRSRRPRQDSGGPSAPYDWVEYAIMAGVVWEAAGRESLIVIAFDRGLRR